MRRLFLAFGLATTIACDSGSLPTEPVIGSGGSGGSGTPTHISIGSIPGDSEEPSQIGFRPTHIAFGGVATDETFAPLASVSVCWTYGCATTGKDGAYEFASRAQGAPTFPFRLCLTATRDGFETRTECVKVNAPSAVRWSPVMRRRPGGRP